MKALQILKKFREDVNKFLNSFDKQYKKDEEYIGAKTTFLKINEAIEEFEALENRTCESCKYLCNITKECENINVPCFGLIIDTNDLSIFYCNKWKSKC